MRARLGIAAGLVVVAAVASAAIGGTVASGQTDIHVVLPGETLKITWVDVQGNGMGHGDRLAARGPLLDETQTDRVGTAYLDCVVQRRLTDGTGLWVCNYVLKLEGGEIMVQGLDPSGPSVSAFAVTGGTGSYNNAQGDGTFTDTKTETDIVIHLTS